MIIEKAGPGDLAEIMALEEHFDVRWSEKSWADELTGEGRLVLIARRRAGGTVGVACFQKIDGVVDLHRIVVDATQRRLGFARVMLVAGLQWAIAQGAERMMLEVDHANEPAINLYKGYGFRPVAERRDYYGPGAHAVIMERGLEGVDADSVGMWDMEVSDE